ncbi:MAG: carboxymuconolactone decarboxylase family protein [Gemmatimonadales bacterium]
MSLDEATRRLLVVAAALNEATDAGMVEAFRDARAAGTSTVWLEELVLEAALFVGYPKALVAAVAFRQVEPAAGDPGDAADYDHWRDWQSRGEVTGRRIYGANYDKLYKGLAALHPAFQAWIVLDGYGRTISRPGLDLMRRELCAIAMLVAQNTPRQLHSHLKGALNNGASAEDVDEALMLLAPLMPPARAKAAFELWRDVREV